MSSTHKRCVSNYNDDAMQTQSKCMDERTDQCCPEGYYLTTDAFGEKLCLKKWRPIGYQKLSEDSFQGQNCVAECDSSAPGFIDHSLCSTACDIERVEIKNFVNRQRNQISQNIKFFLI